MSIDAGALRGRVLAGLTFMGIACPAVLSAGEIRILFISREAGVDAQVKKLERAIRESHGPLAVAEALSDAHVAVQFTEYRRSIGEKGQRLFHWIGHARLLAKPEGMTVRATPLPGRFELLVIGEGEPEEQRALRSLELMLSKALRPSGRPPARETI